MRYQILEPIQADDNLAALLNAYRRKLWPLEQGVMPRETMSECRQLLTRPSARPLSELQAHRLDHCVPHFYYLAVLNNSLTDLYKNIGWCIEALTTFFADYEGDLQRYAIEERLKYLNEDGGGESSDWEPDGFDEEGEKWKVVYKDDEASLAPYTLRRNLEQYFTGADTGIERIGTSQAEDFTYFSDFVERATDFSPVKLLRQFTGAELPVYQQNEAGEMIAQTLGEEVEKEINEDLRNQSLVATFHHVLHACNQAAATHAFATQPEHFQELLDRLLAIRDLTFTVPTA